MNSLSKRNKTKQTRTPLEDKTNLKHKKNVNNPMKKITSRRGSGLTSRHNSTKKSVENNSDKQKSSPSKTRKNNVPKDIITPRNTNAKESNLNMVDPRELTVLLDPCPQLETIQEELFHQSLLHKSAEPFRNEADKYGRGMRERKIKDYKDLLEKTNPDSDSDLKPPENLKHVPVYLQQKPAENKKTANDPFEFVSEPIPKKKKIRKDQSTEYSDSDSTLYDKTMHEVLQRIRTKLSKTKKNFVAVEEKIPPEFRLKKPPQGSSTTTKIIPKAKSKKVKVVDKGKTRAIPSTNSKNVEVTSKPTHNTKIIEKNVKRSTTHVSSSKLDEISPILLNKEVSIHIPTSSEAIPSTTQPTLTSTPISRTSSKNQENKIHIISNIKLTQSIRPVAINPESSTINDTSDDFFGFNDEAKHSSTPQNKTKMNISTPWRSADLNIKRNPHWLSLKDSLLPNYNQEMIWDPELVEKPMYPKTPTRQEPTTSLVQSTILDFIGTNKNTPIKDLNQSSLFDMHTLSPLKNSNQKTRILEDKTNNCDNISLAGSEDEVENFFGFDSMEHDDNKENLRVRRIKFDLNVNKVYGPTRISLGPIKKVFFSANDKEKETPVASEGNDLNVSAKEDEQSTSNEGDEEANQIPSRPRRKGTKYRKQIDLEETEELNNSSAMNETDVGDPDSDFEGSSIAKSKSEDVPLVGLFIDFEEPRPTHQVYISKRRKRGRLLSTHSEHEKEEEEVPDEPKKKKKDVFTPAEEKEFKKWVASFNAMCDDVDKHDLEIE